MATYLYPLGRWAFHRRRRVALLWAAVLAAVMLGAFSAAAAPDDSSSMPGTEAQRAFEIMMAVFGGFMTGGDTMVKMVGFGLAGAVLFDAVVVRMAFVPAVLAPLGKAAWWLPRPLERLLPRVDVEGASLGSGRPGVALAPDGEREDAQRV